MRQTIVLLVLVVATVAAGLYSVDQVFVSRMVEWQAETTRQDQRIEALASRQASLEKDLEAHKEEAERVKELLALNQLKFLTLLERQEKRIRALEKANRAGLFCGGWWDGR